MYSLEDNHEDIIGKAIKGLNLSPDVICHESDITKTELQQLLHGEYTNELETPLRNLAATLQLNADALVQSAAKTWHPKIESLPDGLQCFTTPYGDMTVNAYLLRLPDSKQAIAFDTGADASPMLEVIQRDQLQLTHLFLTHTHGDHIFDLDRLCEKTGATAYVHELEALPGTKTFCYSEFFEIEPLKCSTLQTSGHAKGGTTYFIKGLSKPLAVVGDAIFAGSMGGGMISYTEALETNHKNILTLPDETILCPGHGPITTVALEKKHNPFFA
ncbi:MAG: MBL fold metallo-hydrolase [Verrucomicrobiota bacterium]